MARHDTASQGRDTTDWAAIRPAAHVRGLAGGLYRVTPFCIVTEARDWLLGVVSRYNLCIVIGGQSS